MGQSNCQSAVYVCWSVGKLLGSNMSDYGSKPQFTHDHVNTIQNMKLFDKFVCCRFHAGLECANNVSCRSK